MKRHNGHPWPKRTWRFEGCPLCAHRRAKRAARERMREIQIARRRDVAESYGYSLESARRDITRANYQSNQ